MPLEECCELSSPPLSASHFANESSVELQAFPELPVKASHVAKRGPSSYNNVQSFQRSLLQGSNIEQHLHCKARLAKLFSLSRPSTHRRSIRSPRRAHMESFGIYAIVLRSSNL